MALANSQLTANGLGVAAPKGTKLTPCTGDKTRVGNIVRCLYDRGEVVKRITEVERDAALAFDVLEHDIHIEGDVILLDGAFRLERDRGGRTRLELSTRYRAKLR